MLINKPGLSLLTQKIKFQKPNYYTTWSVANLIVMGTLLAAVILTFFFVYKNIYSLYNNAATIVILNSELTVDVLDFTAYNKILATIKAKDVKTEIPRNLRDIFSYAPGASASSSFYASTTPPNP